MAQLIDTTVLIDAERQGQTLSVLQELLAGESIAVSSSSAAELLLGVERADTLARRQQRLEYVNSILADIPVLPFDLDVARVHARVSAHLLATGQPIPQNDVMIAATALAYGYAMLTHNFRHFERVPGLFIQRPDW